MLNEIYAPIQSEMLHVERCLRASAEYVSLKPFQPIMKSLFQHSGKRLRPALALLSFYSLADSQPSEQTLQKAVKIGAALEWIHIASLIHDDIIDAAPIRHNQPALHVKWGKETAITMGVLLYSLSLRLISEAGNNQVLSVMSKTVQEMCEGELLQIRDRNRFSLSPRGYLLILKKKTACLFAAACQCGAFLAAAAPQKVNAIRKFGLNIGMLYQVMDDYLDILGSKDILGKNLGQDFELGEITLPFIFLLKEKTKSEQEEIVNLFQTPTREHFNQLREKLESSRAIDRTKEICEHFLSKTRRLFYAIPHSPYSASLNKMVEYIENRAPLLMNKAR